MRFKTLLTILTLLALSITASAQWDSMAKVAYFDRNHTISGDWTFTGGVTMDVVIIDSLTIEYIDATYITADSVILGLNKEIMLDSDNDTYIYCPNDDFIEIYVAGNRYRFVQGEFKSSTTNSFSIRCAAGSKTNPTYCFTDDTNTGMYSSGADSLAFAVGGNEMLLVDAVGSKLKRAFRLELHAIAAGDSLFLNCVVDAADTTLKCWNGAQWVTIIDLTP